MTKETLRIVYFGTPEFAVESLKRLVDGGYNIVGVVTMPDKAIGRHQNVLSKSAVKVFAESHGLPLLQPANLKDPEFVAQLKAWQADVQVVVAFRMLPEVVWAMPRFGTFNLHAALLPQYRGAAPINWAIINGERETGITTFFLQHEIDTGNVIQQVRVPIADTDTAGDIHDRLMLLGGDLVIETINKLIEGNIKVIPQEEMQTDEPLKPAPKLFKDNCKIDWNAGVKKCYDLIRGLSPYPAAWTTFVSGEKQQTLKIFFSEKEFCTFAAPVGTIIIADKADLKVALSDGYLHLKEIQPAGKKRMPVADFLRGFRPFGNERVE
ncbi:methionyl-tRNA formyltransferase [Alloprevotella tannerae]|uniref:methionyl-tRNA formyltransferase n=1 Tax=Alloprevotella tannerae TaxID=76122 RepID=UPI0028E4F389|nr:methionyl-tRNA formyltransferase [Alloprevotella tannerae]